MTRPPLPLSPAVRGAAQRLCPHANLDAVTGVALAIAGGAVIGAKLQWAGGEALAVETGWRGRGIEGALDQVLGARTAHHPDTTPPQPEET